MQYAEVWAGDDGTIIPETALTSRRGEETESVSWIFPVNHVKNPIEIATTLVVVDGAPTVTVEHTIENVLRTGFDPDEAVWSPHPDADEHVLTDPLDINYYFPVAGIRMVVTGGTVRMLVRQAG